MNLFQQFSTENGVKQKGSKESITTTVPSSSHPFACHRLIQKEVQMFQERSVYFVYSKKIFFFNWNNFLITCIYFVLMFHLLFKSGVVRKMENTFHSNAFKYFLENPDPRPLIQHLQSRRVLLKSASCSTCLTPTNLQNRKDSQDGLQWRCSKTGRNTKLSVRDGSRFKGSMFSFQILSKYFGNDVSKLV